VVGKDAAPIFVAYLVACGMGIQHFLLVVDRTPVAPPPTKYVLDDARAEGAGLDGDDDCRAAAAP
jgi:hypothetical protein